MEMLPLLTRRVAHPASWWPLCLVGRQSRPSRSWVALYPIGSLPPTRGRHRTLVPRAVVSAQWCWEVHIPEIGRRILVGARILGYPRRCVVSTGSYRRRSGTSSHYTIWAVSSKSYYLIEHDVSPAKCIARSHSSLPSCLPRLIF